MKTGYKIAIGVVSGVAVGFVTYKIIYNHRLKTSGERFTPELQKEALIDNLFILKNIDNTEANRTLYRAKSIKELQDLVNTITEPAPEGSYGDYTTENMIGGYTFGDYTS